MIPRREGKLLLPGKNKKEDETLKKVLPVLLAVILMLSLSVSAFAANLTPSVNKTVVKAGEQVTVTVSLDEELTKITTIAYKLYYNADLFTINAEEDYESLCTSAYVVVSEPKTEGNRTYVNLSTMDPTSKGKTLKVGPIVKLIFTAKADVSAEQAASFSAEYENASGPNAAPITGGNFGAGSAATVTVTPAYSAAVSGGKEIMVAEDAAVSITVTNGAEPSFNAYQFTLTYNPAVVTYKGVSDTEATVKNENGTLTITGYGADKACGTPITVTFTGEASGAAVVTLTKAFVDKGTNAVDKDTPAAIISTPSTTITVNGSYTVSLPDWFTGADTVTPGADYTFTAKDLHYDYTFTGSTMGGSDVTVIDNGDGSFKVSNVTGNLVIKSSRTPKTYTVTATEDDYSQIILKNGQRTDTATYGVDYTFDARSVDDDLYTYTVKVTIGGVEVTPTLYETQLGVDKYRIDGSAITGNIVIAATSQAKPAAKTTIKFEGSGSGNVDGGTSQTATNGQDFTFKINKEAGYNYTVKLDGEALTANADGSYTIPAAKLTGTELTVTVTKTAAWTVDVKTYVQLDGKNVYLITVSGNVEAGKAFAYDSNVMFTSTKYNAAAYLIISEKTLAEVKAEAQIKISTSPATAEAIAYTGDVNGTNKVDVNDAQLVYDIYNAQHEGFATVSMLKFLRADVNGDKTVDVKDATAIISSVLK